MVFSADGQLCDEDIKGVIVEKVGAAFASFLRHHRTKGRAARAAHSGEAHVGASLKARASLDEAELQEYVRGLADIHPCTMPQVYKAARTDSKESPVAQTLRAAGPMRDGCLGGVAPS